MQHRAAPFRGAGSQNQVVCRFSDDVRSHKHWNWTNLIPNMLVCCLIHLHPLLCVQFKTQAGNGSIVGKGTFIPQWFHRYWPMPKCFPQHPLEGYKVSLLGDLAGHGASNSVTVRWALHLLVTLDHFRISFALQVYSESTSEDERVRSILRFGATEYDVRFSKRISLRTLVSWFWLHCLSQLLYWNPIATPEAKQPPFAANLGNTASHLAGEGVWTPCLYSVYISFWKFQQLWWQFNAEVSLLIPDPSWNVELPGRSSMGSSTTGKADICKSVSAHFTPNLRKLLTPEFVLHKASQVAFVLGLVTSRFVCRSLKKLKATFQNFGNSSDLRWPLTELFWQLMFAMFAVGLSKGFGSNLEERPLLWWMAVSKSCTLASESKVWECGKSLLVLVHGGWRFMMVNDG